MGSIGTGKAKAESPLEKTYKKELNSEKYIDSDKLREYMNSNQDIKYQYSYDEVVKEIESLELQEEKGIQLGDTVEVAKWFKFDLPNTAIQPRRVTVVGETEKAWKVDIETESLSGEHDMHFQKYMPKSAVSNPLKKLKNWKEEAEKKAMGRARYSEMIKFAKENNIKGVREKLRKETILDKISAAGYEYDYTTGKGKKKG